MPLSSRLLYLALALVAPVRADPSVEVDPSVWLPRAPHTALRMLSWNVGRAFLQRNADFQRVLRAIDADVLVLDEMAADLSAERISAAMPQQSEPWHALYGIGGGPHERASIVAMHGLERVPAFDRLAYPESRFGEWLARVPPSIQPRTRGSLEAGVAAIGGIVDIDGRRVLVVGLDLQCCGDLPAGPEESRRRFEAASIRAAIDATARTLDLDGVLVGGDFNAVQGRTPVDLLRGAPGASTTLSAVEARHRDHDVAWTWSGEGTPFPSVQLDFVLHSGALVPLQAQVFDSEDLDAQTQTALGMSSTLSQSLSEHRPVVVDFGWRDGGPLP